MTLTVAMLASAFGSLVAAAYAVAGTDPSPIVALFLSVGPLWAIILWLQHDAARTGVGSVLDLGWFLLLAWPFIIPWYAFKTRGRAGWRLMLGLFALILAPYATAWLVGTLVWGVAPAL
jgi:hypothetical protein